MSGIVSQRLLSLDVFRGFTIGAMVLVNNPGTWSAAYPPLLHAKWDGWTFTDIIFPFFVFIMGVAIPFALEKRRALGVVGSKIYIKLLRRSAALFGLGLFLAVFPFYHWMDMRWIDPGSLRIMGVLQRLALCYFFAALLFLWLKPKTLWAAAFTLLIGYWALMVGGGDLSPEGNFSGLIDRMVLGPNHMWIGSEHFDPEGLLSTLPAVATCLFGVITGRILISGKGGYEIVSKIFVLGFALLVLGWMWNGVFPINKSLWSSSYAVFMSGLAMCVLSLVYWLVDIKGSKWWTLPFVIFGVNALALFVGTGMMGRLLNFIPAGTGADGAALSLKAAIYNTVFAPLGTPMNTSLLYAVCFIGLWLFLMWLLYRKNIFIKV